MQVYLVSSDSHGSCHPIEAWVEQESANKSAAARQEFREKLLRPPGCVHLMFRVDALKLLSLDPSWITGMAYRLQPDPAVALHHEDAAECGKLLRRVMDLVSVCTPLDPRLRAVQMERVAAIEELGKRLCPGMEFWQYR